MQIPFGTATLEATPDLDIQSYDELEDRIEAHRPIANNGWDCEPPGRAVPSPPKLSLTAYVRLIAHACDDTGTKIGAAGFPLLLTEAEKRRRRDSITRDSTELVVWLSKLGGFATPAAMGPYLQKTFGEKNKLEVPFDRLIKPFKERYSLKVESKVVYDAYTLSHPRMPRYEERQVYLLIPVGLEHSVFTIGKCTEDGKIEFGKGYASIPETRETVRVPSRTEAEKSLREETNKRKQEAVKKDLKEIEEARRDLDAREKRIKARLEELQKEQN